MSSSQTSDTVRCLGNTWGWGTKNCFLRERSGKWCRGTETNHIWEKRKPDPAIEGSIGTLQKASGKRCHHSLQHSIKIKTLHQDCIRAPSISWDGRLTEWWRWWTLGVEWFSRNAGLGRVCFLCHHDKDDNDDLVMIMMMLISSISSISAEYLSSVTPFLQRQSTPLKVSIQWCLIMLNC